MERKDESQLAYQLVQVGRAVQKRTGQSLIPVGQQVDDIVATPWEDLSQQFGRRRLEIFTNVLRQEMNDRPRITNREWRGIGRFLEIINGLESYEEGHMSGDMQSRLLPTQFEGFTALCRYIANGNNMGYFRLPPGAGKTVIMAEISKAIGAKTLVVVPSIPLIGQTIETFKDSMPDTDIGSVYGRSDNFFWDQITVITYDSLLERVKHRDAEPDEEDLNPADFGLVFFDEAHSILGPTIRSVLNRFPDAIKIGMTATPNFSPRKRLDELMGSEIYGLSYQDAVSRRVISGFRVWLVKMGIDLSSANLLDEISDYNPVQLADRLMAAGHNKGVVDVYGRYFSGEQAISFCASVAHARAQAELFRTNGISAEAVYGTMPPEQSRITIDRFKAGEVQVLCNVQVLGQGFNAPNASVVFTVPTLSMLREEQRGGRALRVQPGNPGKIATIVDFIANDSRGRVTFADIAGAAMVIPDGILPPPKIRPRMVTARDDKNKPVEGSSLPDHFEVIMDIEEVMRIVSRADNSGSIETGFVRMPLHKIAEESGVGIGTVASRVDELRKTNPELFGKDTGRRMLMAQFALNMLREELALEKPEGRIRIPWDRLEREFPGIDMHRMVIGLQEQHPDHFTQHGKKGFKFVTAAGLEILQGKLRDRSSQVTKMTEQGFIRLNTGEIAQQFGVSHQKVVDELNRMRAEHPQGVILLKGVGGSNIDPGLYEQFLNRFRPAIIPAGYTELSVKAQAATYDVAGVVVHRLIREIEDLYPQHVRRQGSNNPILLTDMGRVLLEERFNKLLERRNKGSKK